MIPDYSNESCTYLMLRLKVALKKHDPTKPFCFYGTATQVKTVEGAFPANGYTIGVSQEGDDRYLITMSLAKT